ncbi:Small, acid-soluble spore protein, alpha/beta type [Alkalithermobacter thermoalcaliphilus JW-YL-7 = DSM 7308]|uniref:Small acid-soluble spore protein alpha/beta type n=1 Tax=Alkalithermobacter thermoalcaliphilus JW-YL-7 = DSM 7308 TaxID=1121328 RepID=A0A150FQK6_CLOPD|nr:small acid-soluble spore protein alpha/beta type [[Clostridium] paradoxum JW-YL-7 = DSM 7308]SHK78348.1 Small, acid-soluble spore protein, alpha/beta type [[Clostridium] paradoxum JW-YL-7 = DSM 7308]
MSKKPLDPNASKALKQMKYEIANELGILNDDTIDKGNISSRQNGLVAGYVGGYMTKKLVEIGEKLLINQSHKK